MSMSEETVKTLQTKAASDPIAAAVFHVMAYRQRNRHNMTTRGLYYKLRKEGYKYQEKDLIPLFKMLADLGLATLDMNHRGKVEAIRGFKTPIQKIGEAASKAKPTLVQVPKLVAAPIRAKESIKASITLYVNDKAIEVNLPEKMTKEDLISIVSRFYGV